MRIANTPGTSGPTARTAVAVALTIMLVVALSPSGAAQGPESKSRSCPTLDGKYEISAGAWEGGVAPAGVTIDSASDEELTFTVSEGLQLVDLCVKTGGEQNVYSGTVELPVTGPATITVTKAGPGYGLGHASFDTESYVPPERTCPTVSAPTIELGEPKLIDPNRAGGEPVSIVAEDGSINVSAHAGTTHVYKDPMAAPGAGDFLIGYWNQTLNWRSTDGGETWRYIGLMGQDVGPHTATSTGFSDPDFTMDQAGNIYNVEIDLANVAVFKSSDDGQSYHQANPEAAFGDRPWVTALEKDEVFLYVNLPKMMFKSIDGGITWMPVTSTPAGSNNVAGTTPISPVIGSKAIADPLNPDDGLIGPVGGQNAVGRFAIGVENDAPSASNPAAPNIQWTTHDFGPMGPTRSFFSVVAADKAGNVYQAGAAGYNGPTDRVANGTVTFGYFERENGTANPTRIDIPTPSGDALWPWVVAGDDGRAAVVWYQNLAGEPNKFYIFMAVTHNAHGTTVTCSDGSTELVEPQWTVMNASQNPIHVGAICLTGTSCNWSPSFVNGDRRLGDFFTVNFDLNGHLFITSADTTPPNPLGGPKPVGNPLFIKQVGGEPMLEEPIEPKPTKCRWPGLVGC